MLDDCGIETLTVGGSGNMILSPCRDRCSMAVGSRLRAAAAEARVRLGSRSMLDGCGIETLRCQGRAWGRPLVAIDARWLWDRDHPRQADAYGRASGRDRCSMTVGSRRYRASRRGHGGHESRSMLDGCGIETPRPGASVSSASRSRSMLDDCGIETWSGCCRIAPMSCRD